MNEFVELIKLINSEKWVEISQNYTPEEIAKILKFKKAIKFAHELFIEGLPFGLQEYAIEVLEHIRKKHSEDWNSHWIYDAYLGFIYDFYCDYDNRYLATIRAKEKISGAMPAELLVQLARCSEGPGIPPVSLDEAIEYLKEAIKDYPYVNAVGLLSYYYKEKNDLANYESWHKMWKDLKEKKFRETPPLVPDFINTEKLI